MKDKSIVILGAGGHCRPVSKIINKNFPKNKKVILDENFKKRKKLQKINNIPVIGNFSKLKSIKNKIIFLAICDNYKRTVFFKKYKKNIKNLISDSSLLATNLRMGTGNFINKASLLGNNIRLGSNNIIKNKVIIEHETVIGNNSHISPGCIVGRGVKLGSNIFIGIGSKILPKISICDDVIIRAGSIVNHNIITPGIYSGIVAKQISYENSFVKTKFIIATYGEMGVKLLSKLFQLNISIKNIIVLTHNNLISNNNFIKFLDTFKIKYIYDDLNEKKLLKKIKKNKSDILISFHYRKKIKHNILKIPKYGAVNIHPSLLPKYAGCFSSVWALFNDEKKTGITFHFMKKKFDAGNIILQDSINIKSNDTAFSLFHKLVDLSLKNIFKALNLVIYEKTKGIKQDLSKRTYFSRILPNNGKLNLKWSKKRKNNFLRAMHFPPLFDRHKRNKIN